MKIHNVVQGSPEWHALRAAHFCASEAPAMMGVSPYQTRTALLQQKATGIAPEIDAATQRRFDGGHATELEFRAVAESIIGAELYPVTGSVEIGGMKLLASFDGLTLNRKTGYEHKLYNASTEQFIRENGEPPMHHVWQMEQQLLVSGAEQILFCNTDGSNGSTCYYTSQPERRFALLAGWERFALDLAAWQPEPVAEPVTASPVEALPAVSVRMEGAIAVISNLDLFGAHLRRFIDGLPAKPSTDQEFADAEQACKVLQKAQDALEQAESAALAQTTDIEAMRRTVADYTNLARTTRLALERLVKARKEQIRIEIVIEAQAALASHVRALNERIGGQASVRDTPADFAGAIKGKKTVASIREAVGIVLMQAKIAASEQADRIEANIKSLRGEAHDWTFLFPDLYAVASKSIEDFANLTTARIAQHQAREEQRRAEERERIRAEEEAKARQRIAAEEAARLAAVAPPPAPVEPPPPVRVAPLPAVAAVEATVTPSAEPPTLTLGAISDCLGFTVPSSLLADLGFPFVQVRAAKCYRPSDFPAICWALRAHINRCSEAWGNQARAA
jgi:hypothetical protein